MFDATFWALAGLIIFLGVLAYFGVPKLITKSLDDRSEKIRNQLEEARQLREEAQSVLADYQRKREEAEKEAEEIVAAAKREADAIAVEAKQKTEDYVARRTALAEQKIAQAEADAVNEVRGKSVDVAIAAAASVLGDKVTPAKSNDLFKDALSEIKANLN